MIKHLKIYIILLPNSTKTYFLLFERTNIHKKQTKLLNTDKYKIKVYVIVLKNRVLFLSQAIKFKRTSFKN